MLHDILFRLTGHSYELLLNTGAVDKELTCAILRKRLQFSDMLTGYSILKI